MDKVVKWVNKLSLIEEIEEVKNMADEAQVLDPVSSFCAGLFSKKLNVTPIATTAEVAKYLTAFVQNEELVVNYRYSSHYSGGSSSHIITE